jgi:hypothetical protein
MFGVWLSSIVKYYFRIVSWFSLFIALTGIANSQTDVAGWDKARWGMSNGELIQTFGSQLKKLPKRQRWSLHQYVDYTIPDLRINSQSFTVFFKMDDRTDKLIEVLIRFNETKSKKHRDDVFADVEASFVKTYGVPRWSRDKIETPAPKLEYWDLERIWRFPTTTIELAYLWDNSLYASILGIKYISMHAVN